MRILLSFLPFLIFALLVEHLGPNIALLAGAAVSAVLLIKDAAGGQSPKILEIGSLVLFAGLAVYGFLTGTLFSVIGAKLAVDIGLLAIALVSLLIRKPFTIQYAQDSVDPKYWNSPEFLRKNTTITGVWAAAFLVIVVVEALMLYNPSIPPRYGVVVIVLALLGAYKFTKNHSGSPKT